PPIWKAKIDCFLRPDAAEPRNHNAVPHTHSCYAVTWQGHVFETTISIARFACRKGRHRGTGVSVEPERTNFRVIGMWRDDQNAISGRNLLVAQVQPGRRRVPRNMLAVQPDPPASSLERGKKPADIQKANPGHTSFKKLDIAEFVGFDVDGGIEYGSG